MSAALPRFSVRRPVTVTMGFLALLLLGAIAWTRIPLEMMPGRFTVNSIWVWVPTRGGSPRENVETILQPVEDRIATAPGLKKMRSRAWSGGTQFTLEFHRSVSMDEAYNAVVDRMERAMPDLPPEADRYWVYKWNPADEPIVWGGITFPEDVDGGERNYVVEHVVQPALERVPGVGRVEAWGTNPRAVYLDFHLDRLAAHGVNLADIIGRLGADDFEAPGGRIVDRGRVRYVRSLARWRSLEELRRFPVGDGLVLADVADVSWKAALNRNIARINGLDGAAISVSKESGANTVATSRAVDAAFRALEADPRARGARFVTFFDQGALIHESLDELLRTAAWGGLFAVLVLYAFLRQFRLTLLVAAAMPLTLLMTVTVLYFTGRSLNLLSLMGLMLAVGMVVDCAIVVVEAIHARQRRGEAPDVAAIEGAGEVSLAITLSTLTTMIVFLPVILMSENADFSFFMGEIGMPVVYALAASLLVALVFSPLTTVVLARRAGPARPEARWIAWLSARYRRLLRAVLRRRSDALAAAVAVGLVTMVVPVKAVGCRDEANGNLGDIALNYDIPANFTWSQRVAVVDAVEEFVRANAERWGVENYRSRLRDGSTRGRTWVLLDRNADEAPMSREEVIDDMRERLPDIPGVTMQVGWGGGQGAPPHQVSLVLRGDDVDELERLAGEVRRTLLTVPGVLGVTADVESSAGDEIRLRVDREAAARYGVDARSLGQTVGFALRGLPVGTYREGGTEVDIVAGFRLEDTADLARILDFPIPTPAGGAVPLRALVRPEVGRGASGITRENRVTAWPLTVDVDEDVPLAEATARVDAALEQLDLPRGTTWDHGGWDADQQADQEAQLLALLLSVAFVFIIMGVLFESLLLPMSVLAAIPLALLGVYWTLYLTGTPLDLMGGVGLVVLVGVVVNNGIVLVDLVTRLRHEGLDRTEALVVAGGRRLRPILMTALTTIFGLLPMALGHSTFIGIPYAPLGRVVAGGLATSTVLTLFFVPYLYSVLDDVRGSARRWLAWVLADRRRASPRGAP